MPVIAFQMDPLEVIHPLKDTTYLFCKEALRRGYDAFHYVPDGLRLENGVLTARGQFFSMTDEDPAQFRKEASETLTLSDVDLVLMRQDPPYDMAYISAAFLLDHLEGKTPVLNNPRGVREAPEKLLVTHFPELMPETLITRDVGALRDFRARHKRIVLKPLNGNAGKSIFFLENDDKNFESLVEMLKGAFTEPLVAQRFLDEVVHGDRRILLLDGVPLGGVNRKPPEGEIRANLGVGGVAEAYELTKRDHEICTHIAPTLKKMGLVFVGIDVIGGFLTEINVTSPTGLQELNRFTGQSLEQKVFDVFEKHMH